MHSPFPSPLTRPPRFPEETVELLLIARRMESNPATRAVIRRELSRTYATYVDQIISSRPDQAQSTRSARPTRQARKQAKAQAMELLLAEAAAYTAFSIEFQLTVEKIRFHKIAQKALLRAGRAPEPDDAEGLAAWRASYVRHYAAQVRSNTHDWESTFAREFIAQSSKIMRGRPPRKRK